MIKLWRFRVAWGWEVGRRSLSLLYLYPGLTYQMGFGFTPRLKLTYLPLLTHDLHINNAESYFVSLLGVFFGVAWRP